MRQSFRGIFAKGHHAADNLRFLGVSHPSRSFLKVLLVVAGLLFVCGLNPIAMYLWHPGNESSGDFVMLSLYVTMGVFLLIAVRDPSGSVVRESRSTSKASFTLHK